MPTPNYSDPTLIQWMQQMQQRMSAIEQSFQGVKDANGRTRVKFGLLPNGDYGITLTDLTGNTIELLPYDDDYVNTTLTTSSSSAAAIAGSPSVTVDIAASGDFEVTCASFIGVPSNSSGIIYLVIDGTDVGSIAEVSSQATGGAGASACSIRRWTAWAGPALSPGSHTFSLLYSSSSGTCNFSANYLKIQPI